MDQRLAGARLAQCGDDDGGRGSVRNDRYRCGPASWVDARLAGLTPGALRIRLHMGWPVGLALTKPMASNRKGKRRGYRRPVSPVVGDGGMGGGVGGSLASPDTGHSASSIMESSHLSVSRTCGCPEWNVQIEQVGNGRHVWPYSLRRPSSCESPSRKPLPPGGRPNAVRST
jgi:hypothetical protein